MPEFGDFMKHVLNKSKVSDEELTKGIRFMMAAEFEAVQMYQQLADATDNPLAKKVLLEIADEEKIHAGEFLQLLYELDPEEEGFYVEGAREVLGLKKHKK